MINLLKLMFSGTTWLNSLPSLSIRTLSSLMSLWMIPLSWRKLTAERENNSKFKVLFLSVEGFWFLSRRH